MKLRFISLIFFLLAFSLGPEFLAPFFLAPCMASASESELAEEIGSRITRVPEFDFIRKEAEKLGIRVYLFGGTASSYANYVKLDLDREQGRAKLQAQRFDYDYTNIYRSNQDLDIVVDGTPEQSKALRDLLSSKFEHFLGNKTNWEVRLLREDIGTPGTPQFKEALLHNPDFLNQHTDSLSVGMVEITKPGKGESAVKDLRDWEAKDPQFLKDIREGKIHFYFSKLHETTPRFKQGTNPPIIATIRYLIKAFQTKAEIRPEDLPKIQKIIQEFDPGKVNAEVQRWIEKNGKKLFQNAVDIEYAWNTLEGLELREKLINVSTGSIHEVDSLAWWMNREPLRTKALGSKGRTLAEIFKTDFKIMDPKQMIVAHETQSIDAYESITRAHTGAPNVLASSSKRVGEAAVLGEGFYTKTGKEGGKNTGITIRFLGNPEAREGADFIYSQDQQYFVFKNKKSLEVIPESLNFTPVEYFKFLLAGNGIKESDKALLEKFRRQMNNKMNLVTQAEKDELYSLVKDIDAQNLSKNKSKALVLSEYLQMKFSVEHPELVEKIINHIKKGNDRSLQKILAGLDNRHWLEDKKIEEYLLKIISKSNDISAMPYDLLSNSNFKPSKNFIEFILGSSRQEVSNRLARLTLKNPSIENSEKLIRRFFEQTDPVDWPASIYYIFSQTQTKDMRETIEFIIDKKNKYAWQALAVHAFSKPHTKDMQDLIKLLIKKNDPDTLFKLSEYCFFKEHSAHMVEELFLLLSTADQNTIQNLKKKLSLAQSQLSSKQFQIFKTAISKFKSKKARKEFIEKNWHIISKNPIKNCERGFIGLGIR